MFCWQIICLINVTFILFYRSQQFEAEQIELHQKLGALQKELAVLQQQYDSLLEQVGQQHSFIQQLSEARGTQNTYMESEETQTDGECKAKLDSSFFIEHCCYFSMNT